MGGRTFCLISCRSGDFILNPSVPLCVDLSGVEPSLTNYFDCVSVLL